MYCRKCGTELSEDSKFCPKCGANVKEEGVHTEKSKCSKKRRIAKIAAIMSGCILVFIGALFAFRIINERQYADAVLEANVALENGYYEKAIDSFKDLLEQKPEEVDNYIKIAVAYVESGDLYQAREALKAGYEYTQDEAFYDVSIWGPLSCYESVLLTEGYPLISRCEYIFSDDSVIGNAYFYGTLVASTQYYFSDNVDGRVIGGSVFSYAYPMYGINSEAEKLLNRDHSYSFDCLYNADGEVTAISEYGEEIAVMEYMDGKCISVDLGGEKVDFQYNEKGRIVSVVLSSEFTGNVLSFAYKYNEDGSYSAWGYGEGAWIGDFFQLTQGLYEITFDKAGLMKQITMEDKDFIVIDYNEDGKVICIEGFTTGDGLWNKCEYKYNEDGNISKVLIHGTGTGSGRYSESVMEAESSYIYNENSQLVDIEYKMEGEFDDWYYEESYWHIEYNAKEQIVSIQKADAENIKYIREYTYLDNGNVETFTNKTSDNVYVWKCVYDVYGKYIGEVNISE